MIKLQRPPEVPSFLASSEIQLFRSEAESFYSRPEKSRRQERFEFPLFPDPTFRKVMDAVLALSHNKCAYCETPVSFSSNASIDRFRPKAGAIGLDGDYATDHYWWLAYDWENIYPCCAKCNKFKGPKFPVDGTRAPIKATAEALASESRLIIDPFHDSPEKSLAFTPDGMVKPLSVQGEITIATFELNRSELVMARAEVAREVMAQARQVKFAADLVQEGIEWVRRALLKKESELPPTNLRQVARLMAADRPFAAAARAALQSGTSPSQKSSSAAQQKARSLEAPAPAPSVDEPKPVAYVGTATQRHTRKKAQQLRSQVVTRIEIHNFRGIRDLDIGIDYERGRGAPWTVLLGENGTGKSTILQAVALTLLEQDAPTAVTPGKVLRKGTTTGWVRVWLDDATEPREMFFRKRSRRFERMGPSYRGVLLGYGATRLLPRSSTRSSRGRIRLDNMFDPFRPMLDASRWLGKLDPKSFDFVARALKDVLKLPRSATLRRVKKAGVPGVTLKLFGTDLSLDQLSDGYQSVLGLTCDVIDGLKASSRGALEAAEGLVVVDELGAHLHPRWRMRVVESLRHAFRRVQFLVSTHDPLCLRGLENGEAVVLRRTSRGRIFPVPDLPPIKGLRVDQLLTSEYFGLDSTMDPTVESKYRDLYRLLAVRQPSEAQEKKIDKLRDELKPYDLPGATRRERRLLEIIDKELALTDDEPDKQNRKAIRQQSDRMVADLNRLMATGKAIA